MVVNQMYYGIDEEGELVNGVFLYVMESGDEQWPDEHVVLFNTKEGATHWVDLNHFCFNFKRVNFLDKYMNGW